MLKYDVLLSYPKWNSPNHAYLLADDGKVLFKSKGLSPDLLPHDGVIFSCKNNTKIALNQGGNGYQASIQWLTYSANGTVEGEPIYCHYGRNEDFERLEREFGISRLDGKASSASNCSLLSRQNCYHALWQNVSGRQSQARPVAWCRCGHFVQ